MTSFKLKVAKAYPGDQGGGKIRLDPETMLFLRISPGDIVQIKGKRATYVRAWRALVEDWNQSIARIDRFTRENAEVLEDEEISITPIKEEIVAKKVVLAAPQDKILYNITPSDIRKQLIDAPIRIGDKAPIANYFSTGFEKLIIADIEPKNAVIAGKETNIEFDEKIQFKISWFELAKLNETLHMAIPKSYSFYFLGEPLRELKKYQYDVALSFAGEDREYVEQVAVYLKSRGVNVFYDNFEEVALWGKDLQAHLREVFGASARYCVLFISQHYKEKLWPTYERRAALERALKEKGEYILPARFDDTELPELSSVIAYVNLQKKTPEQFGEMIIKKLRAT